MTQMELPFVEKYDIFTDRLRPVSSREFEIYQEAYYAYGQIREVLARKNSYASLVIALEQIHESFRRRVNFH